MALSRDVKLNVVIILLLGQLLLILLYVNNAAEKTSCVSTKIVEVKETEPASNVAKNQQTRQQPTNVPAAVNPLPVSNADTRSIQPRVVVNPVQTVKVQTQPQDCGSIPADHVLKTMSHRDISQLYHTYVTSIQFSCGSMVRHGSAGDGGWDVCIAPPYTIHNPCIVYSFGIRTDWTFDESVIKSYGCVVHAYDPSISGKQLMGIRNLYFHKEGLDGADRQNGMGWTMHTFKTMLTMNDHLGSNIDILKMDIEKSEWEAIPQMLQSGSLDKVQQFSFEIHIKLNPEREPDVNKYIKGLKLFKSLYHAGFRIFKTHKNPDTFYKSMYGMTRTGCHELNMVRVNSGTTGCQ